MELDEARAFARDEENRCCSHHASEALAALADRLDEIDRRAQQVRGGVKPYARPPEIADFLLATPPAAPKAGE